MNRGTRSQLVKDLLQLHNAVDSGMCNWIEWTHLDNVGFSLYALLRHYLSRKELYLLCVQARSTLVSKMLLGCVGGESAQAERLENAIVAAQDALDDAVQTAFNRFLSDSGGARLVKSQPR